VLPALKQLLQIAKVIAKNSCHKAEKVNEHFSCQVLMQVHQCLSVCDLVQVMIKIVIGVLRSCQLFCQFD